MPFPKELQTPPVTTINLAADFGARDSDFGRADVRCPMSDVRFVLTINKEGGIHLGDYSQVFPEPAVDSTQQKQERKRTSNALFKQEFCTDLVGREQSGLQRLARSLTE